MTWKEFKNKQNHNIPVISINKEARKRLTEIEKDDIDYLFSVRINGKQRLWGIRRDLHAFNLLWWDPKHEICPSKKKHT